MSYVQVIIPFKDRGIGRKVTICGHSAHIWWLSSRRSRPLSSWCSFAFSTILPRRHAFLFLSAVFPNHCEPAPRVIPEPHSCLVRDATPLSEEEICPREVKGQFTGFMEGAHRQQMLPSEGRYLNPCVIETGAPANIRYCIRRQRRCRVAVYRRLAPGAFGHQHYARADFGLVLNFTMTSPNWLYTRTSVPCCRFLAAASSGFIKR